MAIDLPEHEERREVDDADDPALLAGVDPPLAAPVRASASPSGCRAGAARAASLRRSYPHLLAPAAGVALEAPADADEHHREDDEHGRRRRTSGRCRSCASSASPRCRCRRSPTVSSMTSSPTKPREMPLRMPLAMNGSVPGAMILAKTSNRLAPKLRAASISDGSAVCTPSLQLSISGITADKKTSMILVCAPKPSHRMMIGASAMRGIAKKPQRYGEVSRSAVGDMPMSSPSGIPTTSDEHQPDHHRRHAVDDAPATSCRRLHRPRRTRPHTLPGGGSRTGSGVEDPDRRPARSA